MKPQNINMQRNRNTKEAALNMIETMFEMESGMHAQTHTLAKTVIFIYAGLLRSPCSLDNKQSK